MRLLLLGAPCAGRATLISRRLACPVLDMDEEIMSINGGTWPTLEHKRVLANHVVDDASHHDSVVLTYSLLDEQQLAVLHHQG